MEPKVQRTLRAIIRPGGVFLDIGANVGFFTILGARLVGESGSVVAFEPEPRNVAALRDNVALNSFANVTVVAAAVSNSTGTAALDVPHRATARLLPGDYGDPNELQVATTSIDGYLSRHPGLVPDVIKLDVEGHEHAVIDGMRETLARFRPTVVCELHRTNVQVESAFDRAGYRTTVVDSPGSIAEAPGWAHVLAVPRD
jgi:FkbM family methyltransferase